MAVFVLLFHAAYAQEKDVYEQRWEEISKDIEYKRSSRPVGPQNKDIYPQALRQEDGVVVNTPPRSDEEIEYSREKTVENGKSDGVQKHIKDADSEYFDDFTLPEQQPKQVSKKWNGNQLGNGTLFKVIFILVAVLLIAFLIYHFFFKNKNKSVEKINTNYNIHEDIHPEKLAQTSLEKDLNQAIAQQEYRVAVRIYYILLLKALIQLRYIEWKKNKTNIHYAMEMQKTDAFSRFQKALQIYEWCWYGKNEPDQVTFEGFSSFFNHFLNHLKDEK
ncbi:hypothetical protein [Brumimicrobium salinarum]|uniref:hypothetical protein n=1 Tax=Brumimicrobium salinarum TaxID=2058658 RepID=UPI0010561CE4|nr:hypothetical protein [Brumimicrobium salinarum]